MHPLLSLASLWASAKPELLSGLAVAALLIAGALAVARLLRDEARPPEGRPADPWLRRELQSTWAARAEALAAIRASQGAVRGALEALLADPLSACDERILTIASALNALSDRRPPTAVEERDRLLRSLERESDPRARDLLEASLADLDAVERARAEVERRLRLARLELSRLRALLEGIPERVRELESRRVFEAPLGVEGVAAQFAEAVTRTSEDLIEVLALADPTPIHLNR